ncbi:proteasome regulatory particle subunit [Protomyces lactucae-debilis]|uniref:Proteasome regulatory particle subunit n=1 Tax=Protomyces lactucae-debilis TaxID=2754530 RepID=A0A1Y2F1Q4_PROLT|nr:proteasome regulatory particle subunit [Protomyces lactucae-debilis]ORY77799.1 proteasome regulatory particle subunit [Protomyces lactucae-debilis]
MSAERLAEGQAKLQQANDAATEKDYAQAESLYRQILTQPFDNDAELRLHEAGLTGLAKVLQHTNNADALVTLIKESRGFLARFAKSKTAKLMRTLMDALAAIPDSTALQIDVTRDSIHWAQQEKRVFLRQSLETRLVSLLLTSAQYQDALDLIASLLTELKKLDDKLQLVEVHLLESRVHHLLRNLAKSRAALTSAKTAGNSVYCPPGLQAQMDLQSGILHAEEHDYETAYSYFFEALEGFSAQEHHTQAQQTLKYMLLAKIMLNQGDDVQQLLKGKWATQYAGRDLDAIKAVAQAHGNRSLAEFEGALSTFQQELASDAIVRQHFAALYDTLLESNLVKVIEPFSTVEIPHVAKQVGLSPAQVEAKLSQMVLDKVIFGVIDQGTGCLVLHDEPELDQSYEAALETIKQMSTVVDLLYEKAVREASEQDKREAERDKQLKLDAAALAPQTDAEVPA